MRRRTWIVTALNRQIEEDHIVPPAFHDATIQRFSVKIPMLTGDQALADFIRQTIRETGPVTFAWFMEQALYHPEHGYFSSDRAAIGRGGDYFTNVSVGPLFGQLLAV